MKPDPSRLRVKAVPPVLVIAEQTEDAIEAADRYAHEKPWHLVAVAGLVGLAFGVLVSRR